MRKIQILNKHMKNIQPHLQSNKCKLKKIIFFIHYIGKGFLSNSIFKNYTSLDEGETRIRHNFKLLVDI